MNPPHKPPLRPERFEVLPWPKREQKRAYVITDQAEWGRRVTIGIAAICLPRGPIISVSDQRLSDLYDSVPARDHAALKVNSLADKWCIMFAGNGQNFFPLSRAVRKELKAFGGALDLSDVKRIARDTFWAMSEDGIITQHLYRFGFRSLTDFRQNGFAQLGDYRFQKIANDIEAFRLGTEFIIFGFDKNNTPHIFSLSDPGNTIDHDLEDVAVIGSGSYMARGSLHRSDFISSEPQMIHRLLEAKFAAETASGVGESTAVLILTKEGKVSFLKDEIISAVRKDCKVRAGVPISNKIIEKLGDTNSFIPISRT